MSVFTKKQTNIFSTFLAVLGVKYTTPFANHLFEQHPYKNSLYGLSLLLTDYAINNLSFTVHNKVNDLAKIKLPFVAQIEGNLIIVSQVSDTHITYYCHENRLILAINDFIALWTGTVLIAKPDVNSGEPKYSQHCWHETLMVTQEALLLLSIVTLVAIGYWTNTRLQGVGVNILVIMNLIGLYISYLLVLTQIHIHSSHAERICSLLKNGSCNTVLDSKGAKLFGVIGWSEVGFGYFIANLFILFFLPHLISVMTIINTVAVVYSFYSIWYQKFIAKSWCALCLTVQTILWLTLFIIFIFGLIQFSTLTIIDWVTTLAIYLLFSLGMNLFIPKLEHDQ